MLGPILMKVVVALLSGLVGALGALCLLHIVRRPKSAMQGANWAPKRRYIFQDNRLVSDHGPNDPFIGRNADTSGAWTALAGVLGRVNPLVPTAMETLRTSGAPFLLLGRAGAETLSVAGSTEAAQVSVTVAPALSEADHFVLDAASYHRHRDAAETWRLTADASPGLAWREAADGQITWANTAYLRQMAKTMPEVQDGGHDGGWPIAPLFGDDIRPLPPVGQTRRASLSVPGRAEPFWFELSAQSIGSETCITAVPADRLVAAEHALSDFVQTLSKSFADLPIGLAIFDRRRELVLFNPALSRLSTLDVQFLSARPTLYDFLDQLRERRQMPEPRDYRAWRARISQLEADAEEGTYQELWTLPTGQTYRVIGRPHPDGAIAFMFEDISAEVSLTRQFRADLDLYQATIDETPEAVAVFSGQGQLVLSNA
ncbi:MAG: PAS-domain containing protein, partial [Pseudomonadota bacterium]